MAADQPTQFAGKVLAVDDNDSNRAVIQTVLTKLGLRVAFAEDGAQAVEAITRGAAADLILMDLQMPVMDGYAATAQIRLWESTHGLKRHPIVALTAHAYKEDRQRCLDAGMDDLLTKPIVIDDLCAALRRWLPEGAETLVAGAPALPAVNPPDVPRIVMILDELLPLLQQNRFRAFARFRELEALVAHTDVAAEIADAAKHLQLVQFDQVLAQLVTLAQKRDWKISGVALPS